ncbi:MAG: hypothetical protein QG659_381 [Patescibacteria group bacterium]|nr:hypothetical protein [Patescibacteria group bacterium]
MGDSRKSAKRKLTLVLDDLRVVLFYGMDLRNKLKEVQSGCTKIKLCKAAEGSQYHIAFVPVLSGCRSFYNPLLLPKP